MFKKILINVFILALALVSIEYYCFQKTKLENSVFFQQASKTNENLKDETKYTLLKPFNTTIWRKSFYKTGSDKNPIIWLGCSFAEGAGLEDNQTPCYKISELTGRSCINKAKGATGTQFMYYQLNNPQLREEIPKADYIIYTFIWNHLYRLYNYKVNPLVEMFNLRYKYKNGKLEEIKPFCVPCYSSFAVRRFLNGKNLADGEKETVDFKLFNAIMESSVKAAKKNYPEAKFIMLEFPDLSLRDLPQQEIQKLESYGITVVRVKDLFNGDNIYDKKYWLSDNIHPAEQIWNIILPKLARKYIKN